MQRTLLLYMIIGVPTANRTAID